MKLNIRTLSISLLLLFLTIACSSQSFFDIKPEEIDYELYQGREILTKETNNIISYVNFEHQEENFLVFYAYIINDSQNQIVINPETFYLNIDEFQNQEEKVSFNKYSALDPEIEIESIKNEMSDLEDEHSANVGLNCLFAAFNIVADLVEGEEEEAVIDAGEWTGTIMAEHENYEAYKAHLKENKKFWENEVLRITTLYEGEEIGGLIYFPLIKKAAKFTLQLEFGEELHNYRFKQLRID
ncbi:hypothetical protein ACFLS9_02480 [Bacteroidota bacterium]